MRAFSHCAHLGTLVNGVSVNKRIHTQVKKSFTSARVGGDVEIILWGTVLILALPKKQHLVWISAGGAAGM